MADDGPLVHAGLMAASLLAAVVVLPAARSDMKATEGLTERVWPDVGGPGQPDLLRLCVAITLPSLISYGAAWWRPAIWRRLTMSPGGLGDSCGRSQDLRSPDRR